ncbi:MAG: competence protein TfoX [Mesorhizobium amorphae]|nr:MAG: competence protein TfoX [Mesorhizobium amorphae]
MDEDALREIFAGIEPVSLRRMFGGVGIYHQCLIVGVALRGTVMLKGDETAARVWEAEGAERWHYAGKKRPVAMPYWSIPDAVMDEPERLAEWTRAAFAAAARIADNEAALSLLEEPRRSSSRKRR